MKYFNYRNITKVVLLSLTASVYAESYKINVTYKDQPQPMPSALGAQMVSVSSSGSPKAKSAVLNVEPDKTLQEEIDKYVKENRLVSKEKFIETYGVPMAAFVLARMLSKQDPSIRYALPTGIKYQLNSQQVMPNATSEYTGENVTQWFRQAWDMGNSTSTTTGIDAPGAWALINGKSLSPVYVAVIDDGVAPNAPYDFKSRLDYSNSYNFLYDEETDQVQMNGDIYANTIFHGTHVGGTIFANGPNITGVVGNILETQAYALRAITASQGGGSIKIAELWAVDQIKNPQVLEEFPYLNGFIDNPLPAKVLNQSYGVSRFDSGDNPVMTLDAWVDNIFIPTCQIAKFVNDLVNATGAVQVMAAGNDGHGLINDSASGCPNIFAVVAEATGPNGELTDYSTRYDAQAYAEYEQFRDILQEELGAVQPQSVIVRAPGGDTNVTLPGDVSGGVYSSVNCPTLAGSDAPTPGQNLDCYGAYNGTSMAAPHVSGMVALIYMLQPSANYSYVANILQKSANERGVLSARKIVENILNDSSSSSSDDSTNNTALVVTLSVVGGVAAITAAVLAAYFFWPEGEEASSSTAVN
jgi:subtilisin family serine protease